MRHTKYRRVIIIIGLLLSIYIVVVYRLLQSSPDSNPSTATNDITFSAASSRSTSRIYTDVRDDDLNQLPLARSSVFSTRFQVNEQTKRNRQLQRKDDDSIVDQPFALAGRPADYRTKKRELSGWMKNVIESKRDDDERSTDTVSFPVIKEVNETRGNVDDRGNSVNSFISYPGIRLLPHYSIIRRLEDFNMTSLKSNEVDDISGSLSDLGTNAEIAFYHAVESTHVTCDDIRRLGNFEDGGWNVCVSKPYTLHPGKCLVYSFGINNDFSFDDVAARDYGCEVYAFDPSMSVHDYVRPTGVKFFQLGLSSQNTVTEAGWKLMTLDSIRRRLRHTDVVIDLLKIDIDYSEWESLAEMVATNALWNVRQVVFEIHTPDMLGRTTTELEFHEMWHTLADIELAGFRRHSFRYNAAGFYFSSRTGLPRTCCYDFGYINIRFLNA